jgi:2-C-methyl-D-erythritol 4-phosphate cytidylyltransferase
VVAVRPDEQAIITQLWSDLELALPLRLAAGGATRQASVQAALKLCRGDLVAVHDAARPLADSHLLLRVCAAARRHGAAIAALPASDTVKLGCGETGDFIEATLPRTRVWLAQTPQVFGRELLLRAHAQAQDEGFVGTDCSSLVERLPAPALAPGGAAGPGAPSGVALVAGDPCNFKVTFAADLTRAEALRAAGGAPPKGPRRAGSAPGAALPVAD